MLIMAEIDALEGFNQGARSFADQYNRATRKGLSQRSMTSIGFTKAHDFHWDPFLADTFGNGYFALARAVDLPKQASRQTSLCKQGHIDEKLSQAQQASSLDKNDYYLHNEVGKLNLARGNYPEAEKAFKSALELCPKCHIALFEIAHAYGREGKTADAASAIIEYHQFHGDTTVPNWLVDIAKSTPADKRPPPPITPPQQSQPGAESSQSGF
jgi:tetratricopeptide (TPR) repeat protein